MNSIAYYISSHGFGHAVRSCQVIRSLKKSHPELTIHVRSLVPEWIVQHSQFPVVHSNLSIDIGMVQEDSLQMDIGATLRACRALHSRFPALLDKEEAFVKDHNIRLILGDIPPLCFEVAARTGIPSVAITNFTWSWIYNAYVGDYPAFKPLISEMEGFYRKATLALSLPYSCNLDIFPQQERIPLITRVSQLTKDESRKSLGLPRSAPVVLLSFGGMGLKRLPLEALSRQEEFFFVTTGEETKQDGNILVLPQAQQHYEHLVRAADIIVSKPGYGIVADVIAHQVPLLYTYRGDFAEYPFLVDALKHWATSEFISQDQILAADFTPYLKRLLEKPKNWPSVSLNGAEIAAQKVLALME